jgi:uncharacterized phage-associated protein
LPFVNIYIVNSAIIFINLYLKLRDMCEANLNKKIAVLDLANFILKNYGPMSQLKLQKLIYYSEGYNLAYTDNPLTEARYEAWLHGPVVREVFNVFRDRSLLHNEITFEDEGNNPNLEFDKLAIEQQELLTDVLEVLSTWTPLQLEDSTHEELPWKEARIGYNPEQYCDVEIKKETMRKFYKAELYG